MPGARRDYPVISLENFFVRGIDKSAATRACSARRLRPGRAGRGDERHAGCCFVRCRWGAIGTLLR
jgi:hypothetical protein